jgi:hypothetical protein
MWCGSGSWPPLVLADEACVARLDALAERLTAIGDAHLTVHVVGPPELVWDDRQPPEITTQAPLLVVPDVLGPEQCASSSPCGSSRATARPGWSPRRAVGAASSSTMRS